MAPLARTWGPDGALYITDGNRIRRVTLDGQVTTLALTGGFGKLLGIAVDGTGNLFVADPDNKCAWKVERQSNASVHTRSSSGWVPVGEAVFGNDLWVSERRFHSRRFGFLPAKSPDKSCPSAMRDGLSLPVVRMSKKMESRV